MSPTHIIKNVIPFILLFALVAILGRELFYAKPNEIPSPLIGEIVPTFTLPDLQASQKTFSNTDLLGQVTLLNVWATWCYACGIEMPMLMKIKNEYHVPIYSIAYKDNPEDAKKWLALNGNPYVATGDDRKGNTAIDLGVYGTPETFIVSKQGQIIYKHVGIINQQIWDEVLYPLVKKYDA
jgi:cytochrome c biogenesis protein CcmG, thiol:disulfide interchange protein DsbE